MDAGPGTTEHETRQLSRVSRLAVSRLLVLLGTYSYVFELQNYGGCRRRSVNKSAFKCHFSVQKRLFLVKNT